MRMIDANAPSDKKDILQNALRHFPENFSGLGKLKHHQVKLHVNPDIKPVAVPPRSSPYHLRDRVQKSIDGMIRDDVIEEHPINEPAPWVSCAVIDTKNDGDIRATIDARNANKAISATNHPIPRQEDIRSKLSGAKVFSKLDFKSAFWQLELHPDSRYVTVFHANDKLYRYKRLPMGMSPAQGELNVALKPVFAHIESAHLIHDDLIIATNTFEEHEEAVSLIMQAISRSGLTLNPKNCHFGMSEIEFWGMIIGADGVKPDPTKVDALNHITRPESKEELISFLCMMQANSQFIENFAKKSACLRALTKGSAHFRWKQEHEQCFQMLLKELKEDTLLRYFDLKESTFIFTDAHKTGLGATLAQGESIANAKPVAFASRTTNQGETRYPLEAMILKQCLLTLECTVFATIFWDLQVLLLLLQITNLCFQFSMVIDPDLYVLSE